MTGRERLELRRAAARLFAAGASRARVTRELGVSRSTAGRWFRIWVRAGGHALQHTGRPGRRSRLDAAARQAVQHAVSRPPAESGFAGDTWSLAAIALLIERVSGERYHRRHVGRLLRSMGWVVPPVGRFAHAAFRRVAMSDPEGNGVALLGR